MGDSYPRLTQQGNIYTRLRFQYHAYYKADTTPKRVKPIPIQVFCHTTGIAVSTNNSCMQETCDMITLDLFSLLRPGKYNRTKSESTPFCICDSGLRCGKCLINGATASEAEIAIATFTTLKFKKHKNIVQHKVIIQGKFKDPPYAPRQPWSSALSTSGQTSPPPPPPLAAPSPMANSRNVTPTDISNTLNISVLLLVTYLVFKSSGVSSCYLRAAGTMVFLCADVDINIIKLTGSWRLYEMIRYLHVNNGPIMKNFLSPMVRHMVYNLFQS